MQASAIRQITSLLIVFFMATAIACWLSRLAHAQNHDSAPRIIALGDMHGDFQVYEKLMQVAELMDLNGDWIGGDTVFVQTGDIPDRGPSTRRIIESLQRLEAQAPKSGGKVIALVGNHEAMNVVRNLRYVHPGEFAAFADEYSVRRRAREFLANWKTIAKEARGRDQDISPQSLVEQWLDETPLGKVEHERAWSPDGDFGAWVGRNKLVAKVDSYLFAHGGFSLEYSTRSLDDINEAGRAALARQDWSKDSILRDNLGPLWYRGNVRGRGDEEGFSRAVELEQILDTYGASHVIIGHTRNEAGIRSSLGGRLIQIDTGASVFYGGVPSYLRIENGQLFAHTFDAVVPLSSSGR